jgi:hypothetical protein
MLEQTVSELLNSRPAAPPAERRPSRKRTPARARLVDARAEGEDRAILAARDIDFPFYFPTRRTRTAAYDGQEARTYRIRDEDGAAHDAYLARSAAAAGWTSIATASACGSSPGIRAPRSTGCRTRSRDRCRPRR